MKRMGWCAVRWFFLASAIMMTLVIGVSNGFGADRPRKTAILVRPKRNEVVSRNYEVSGKMFTPGQPLVLIRPEVEDVEWWPQPTGDVNEKGYFKSKVCFGNDRSRSGDRFQIVVVTLRSREEAELFKGKEFVTELPKSLLMSNPISVTLDKSGSTVTPPTVVAEDPEQHALVSEGILIYPAANSQVQTETKISGKLPADGYPVALIRSEDANDPWWVQGPVNLSSDGKFELPGHFGNEQTANGMKFHVLVLIFPTQDGAQEFAPGLTVSDIPQGVPRSEEIIVTLKRTDATSE